MQQESDNESGTTYKVMQPLLLGAFVAIGMMVGYKMNDLPQVNLVGTEDLPMDSSRMTGRVEELIRFIDSRYVEDLDQDMLIDEALDGVFSRLDPHSVYIPKSEVQDVADQMDGHYHGIGIENILIDDTLCVTRILSGGPAQKAGLLAFDKIMAIDGKPITGKESDWDKVRPMLRKEPGSEVTLSVRRNGRVIPDIKVKVDEVVVPTVHAGLMDDISTLYLKIDRFGSTTYKEFMEHIEKHFKEGNASHIIIDLRGNPGGFLPEATNILCQIFDDKGKLLLYTEGRNSKRNEYKSTGKRFFEIDRVVVLIDENSASASEIVAGAIQDWDRGVVIGRRSYGKGLVQEQYDLTNGGAVRLTVARYYTPSGRSIQRDYADREKYENDHEDRIKNGDLFIKDSTLIKPGHSHYTLLEKRKVEEAGGITPDIFIALPDAYRHDGDGLLRSDVQEFVYRYLDKNRSRVPRDIKAFGSWTIPSDLDHSSIRSFLTKNFGKELSEKEASSLDQDIKAMVAGYLFADKEAKVPDPELDPYLKAAREVVRQKVTLSQISAGWNYR